MPASRLKTGVWVYRPSRNKLRVPRARQCLYCKVYLFSQTAGTQYCPSCRPKRAVDRASRHDTPDKKAARQAKRRARQAHKGAENLSYDLVSSTHGPECHICGITIDRGLRHPHPGSRSFDHVIPLSKGGAHILANVKLAHLSCNMRKGNRQ